MLRCTNCDFEGKDSENKICPDCGHECENFEEMTEEQEQALDLFFENGDFVIAPGKEDGAEPYKYLFEDYSIIENLVNKDKNLNINTLVLCDGDQAWIYKGTRTVDRYGYFLSKNNVEVPQEGIRYW